MKRFRRIIRVLKYTGTLKMLTSFIIFYCAASIVLWLIDPSIKTMGDGFWYCFVSCTTIGFGDIVAVSHIGRVITVLTAIYAIVVTAMIPGVVVSYYMEFMKTKENETISQFFEKLERLPELSQEELAELSERVKKFEKTNGAHKSNKKI